MGLLEAKKHSIGKTIAELRKAKGWTQIELAEKLQVSDKAVSKWEKDSGAPSVEFFPALAELFGVSIDYLMTGKKPEPEIITMSKIELCAKNDDVTLLAEIDCKFKDENGRTIIDYILQYRSYKVFVGLCEKNKYNITNFKILDALEFAILSNRLDLLRDITFSTGYIRYPFQDEHDILDLLPKSLENKFYKDDKLDCILTDEFFEMIACDDEMDKKTRGVLLGKQKGRECVWYHVFPYLIHQSYLHNKTDMLKKLLSQSNRNNNYAYENMPLTRDTYNGCYNYTLNFFFIGNKYNKSGHGLVRILEETIKLALDRGDFDNFEKFNAINTAIIKYYDFKPYIATEYEIKMAKLKADKTISKEELTIQSTIHNGIVNLDELLATKNLNLIKKVLTDYPIHQIEILYGWFKDKNWRKLFEYAIDNNLSAFADDVINQDFEKLELQLINIFYKFSDGQGYPISNGKTIIVRNSNLNKQFVYKELMLKRYSRIHKSDFGVEKIIEYLTTYKQQIIADATYELEKEKTISELTKEYFETELAKGNVEIVIVKLCVRLEAILRSSYHYEGDFSEMLSRYCSNNLKWREDDGWGYMVDRSDDKTINLLNALRLKRNSIVHSEKTNVSLSKEDIHYCIDYICNMR